MRPLIDLQFHPAGVEMALLHKTPGVFALIRKRSEAFHRESAIENEM